MEVPGSVLAVRGRCPLLGPRASAAFSLRDVTAGALPRALVVTVALLGLVGASVSSAPPSSAQADDTEDHAGGNGGTGNGGTGNGGTGNADGLPTCAEEVAGLSLATTLDFANVPRSFAAEGTVGDPRGTVASYELYCPSADVAPTAPSDAAAPLELLLSWAVLPDPDGPGCRTPAAASEDDDRGVVADAERQAQVQWALLADDATVDQATAAAEDLLALTPADVVSCDDELAQGAPDEADDAAGDSSTTTPMIVIGGAALVALLAAIVLLVRRKRSDAEPEATEATPGSVPVVPAVGPTPTAGPLVAGSTAPRRMARNAPEPVQRARAAALSDTATRARAGVAPSRAAPPRETAPPPARLALGAAAAATLADADLAHQPGGVVDPNLQALAENLRTIARGAGRAARRAPAAPPPPPSQQGDALLRATTRLVDAHHPLLGGHPRSEPTR